MQVRLEIEVDISCRRDEIIEETFSLMKLNLLLEAFFQNST
jgi:hypothetical protein